MTRTAPSGLDLGTIPDGRLLGLADVFRAVQKMELVKVGRARAPPRHEDAHIRLKALTGHCMFLARRRVWDA